MLTLNQIIAQIQALATAHAQVASSGVGTLAEWQANPDRVYPLIWLFHERTDVTDSAIIHRIRLIAADRVKVGESGEDNIGHEQEVLSDMLSVLLDFVAYFAQQHGQSYIVERSGSIEPFTERGNDRVAGVSYVLNVRQPIDFSKCQIPQSGATIPPSVDGLTLYDFCDPAVIARLTPSQVACLEAEFGVVCDPVTLTINGTSAGSEPSGGEFEINVTLDGSPSGSWDGVDTWEVTSAPCANATANLFNTVPTLLSTTPIASGASANITAPNATAVLKDTANNTLSTTAIPSNVSQNITAPDATITLNGSAYGSAPSGATFNVTTTPPSLSVASSNATPNLGAIVTLTATPTNLVPTGYTWYANGNQIGTGSSLAWTVNIAGAISIRCVATDGTLTAQGTVSITSLIVAQSVVYLDGVNDGFSFTALPDDDDLGALTFRFRFLSEATGSSWPLSIVSNQAMGELLRLNITTSQAITYVWTGTGFLIGTANYLVGQWNELTFSRKTNSTVGSQNVTRIWLNGSLVNSAINTGSPAAAFLAFFGQTIYGNTKMKVKALTLFQGITDNAGASALAAQADADLPAASGLTLVEHMPFTQAPFTPSTVQPLSRVNGITGRGFCQFNTSFAAPFGLVAP